MGARGYHPTRHALHAARAHPAAAGHRVRHGRAGNAVHAHRLDTQWQPLPSQGRCHRGLGHPAHPRARRPGHRRLRGRAGFRSGSPARGADHRWNPRGPGHPGASRGVHHPGRQRLLVRHPRARWSGHGHRRRPHLPRAPGPLAGHERGGEEHLGERHLGELPRGELGQGHARGQPAERLWPPPVGPGPGLGPGGPCRRHLPTARLRRGQGARQDRLLLARPPCPPP